MTSCAPCLQVTRVTALPPLIVDVYFSFASVRFAIATMVGCAATLGQGQKGIVAWGVGGAHTGPVPPRFAAA